MAKMMNSLEDRAQKATPGERRFGRLLRSHLEDDYLCWFDLPLGPVQQHPDFVILHPSRGILILEVKDWKRATLLRLDKDSAELLFASGGRTRVANPLKQARAYMFTVVNCLERDPQLVHASGPHLGKLCFPYGYGVVLTEITRAQLDAALTEEEQELVFPARLVICKDEMAESVDPLAFQERLWRMFHHTFGAPLSLPQIERVRWHLFPEIRLDAAPIQQSLFCDRVQEEAGALALRAEIPDVVRILDIQQEQLARSLGAGHRVIHGVAGSGKTLILGYRCLHLAEMAEKPILVLCFNITLASRLRAFMNARGIGAKVHVYNFHDWCKAQLETYHAPLAPGPRPIYERQVESVIAGVEKGFIPRAQYEAVMIDEGHDFEPDWLRLVAQMVDPVSDSLLLLYDDAQAIYRKKGSLDFSLSSVGIKAPGRTTILRLNYRNTREIFDFARRFVETSFTAHASTDEDHVPRIQPESAGCAGHRPVFRLKESIEEEIAFAGKCVRKWQAAGEALQEIAIVCLNYDHARLMHEHLQRESVPHLWMGRSAEKHAYDPALPQVSILMAHSSKGLEFRAVVLIGLGHFGESSRHEEPAKLLYVGMTRAREKLVVTASARNTWVERLEKLAA